MLKTTFLLETIFLSEKIDMEKVRFFVLEISGYISIHNVLGVFLSPNRYFLQTDFV